MSRFGALIWGALIASLTRLVTGRWPDLDLAQHLLSYLIVQLAVAAIAAVGALYGAFKAYVEFRKLLRDAREIAYSDLRSASRFRRGLMLLVFTILRLDPPTSDTDGPLERASSPEPEPDPDPSLPPAGPRGSDRGKIVVCRKPDGSFVRFVVWHGGKGPAAALMALIARVQACLSGAKDVSPHFASTPPADRVQGFTSRWAARRMTAALLAGTMLSPASAAPFHLTASLGATGPTPTAELEWAGRIQTLRVEGAQRVDPDTVLSYTMLRPGIHYSNETLDEAARRPVDSGLFAEASISGAQTGDIVARVRENPMINRVALEGNKALKHGKIGNALRLQPRQIFTRKSVGKDVARIIEVYHCQTRFAATAEPKTVSLDQNRIDVIFEISEGEKSKARPINIADLATFVNAELRGEIASMSARVTDGFGTPVGYGQDRLAFDQHRLRQFYLTKGYADFRAVSAVVGLTPDKCDLVITNVVEEGPRHEFGPVAVASSTGDLDTAKLIAGAGFNGCKRFDRTPVRETVEKLGEAADSFGSAFADGAPAWLCDPDAPVLKFTPQTAGFPRTYVERAQIGDTSGP